MTPAAVGCLLLISSDICLVYAESVIRATRAG